VFCRVPVMRERASSLLMKLQARVFMYGPCQLLLQVWLRCHLPFVPASSYQHHQRSSISSISIEPVEIGRNDGRPYAHLQMTVPGRHAAESTITDAMLQCATRSQPDRLGDIAKDALCSQATPDRAILPRPCCHETNHVPCQLGKLPITWNTTMESTPL
jgi:hypothetical protein